MSLALMAAGITGAMAQDPTVGAGTVTASPGDTGVQIPLFIREGDPANVVRGFQFNVLLPAGVSYAGGPVNGTDQCIQDVTGVTLFGTCTFDSTLGTNGGFTIGYAAAGEIPTLDPFGSVPVDVDAGATLPATLEVQVTTCSTDSGVTITCTAENGAITAVAAGVVTVGDAPIGNVEVGSTGNGTLLVTNNTAAAVDATAFTTTGDTTVIGVSAGTCTADLAANGGTCELAATCTPTAEVAYSVTVGYPGVTDTGSVTCTGAAAGQANLSASPSPVILPMDGDTQSVTVTNNGDAQTTLGTITVDDAAFTLSNNLCDGATLTANGGTCTFDVTFNGTDAAMGTASVPFNGSNLDIPLRGGQPPIAIPTLSQWSMMIMGAMLAMLAMVGLRRQS